MSVRLDVEEFLTFREAAKLLPGRPHIATLYRWAGRGIRGVRLKTTFVGGRRFVMRRNLQEFIAETSARSPLGDGRLDLHPDSSAAMEELERALDAEGI